MRKIQWLVVIPALALACQQQQNEQQKGALLGVDASEVSAEDILATVDGVPITRNQVLELQRAFEGEYSTKEILNILIDHELLVAEAKRRGWDVHDDVHAIRKKTLARVLLERNISEGITPDGLDKEKLRRFYEVTKRDFVHGVLRQVDQIVLLVGKKKLSEEEARTYADEIWEKAQNVTSSAELKAIYKPYREKLKKKIAFEKLPPFPQEKSGFAQDFVDAVFSIPQKQMPFGPFKTDFGYHVVFYNQELPASNRSFEEVQDEMARGIVPEERKIRAKELLDGLLEDNEVYIFEEELMKGESQPVD